MFILYFFSIFGFKIFKIVYVHYYKLFISIYLFVVLKIIYENPLMEKKSAMCSFR